MKELKHTMFLFHQTKRFLIDKKKLIYICKLKHLLLTFIYVNYPNHVDLLLLYYQIYHTVPDHHPTHHQ